MKNFPLTYDGYHAALEWCEEKGIDTDNMLRGELSTDGFIFIVAVNDMRRYEPQEVEDSEV